MLAVITIQDGRETMVHFVNAKDEAELLRLVESLEDAWGASNVDLMREGDAVAAAELIEEEGG